jgi:ribosomal-protein-alanine N-acetyltransferase
MRPIAVDMLGAVLAI